MSFILISQKYDQTRDVRIESFKHLKSSKLSCLCTIMLLHPALPTHAHTHALSICISIFLYVSLFLSPSFYSISLSVCLSVCLSVFPSLCLSLCLCLYIALVSGAPLQTLLGKLTTLPRAPSHEGLLAFGACTFPNFRNICPPQSFTDLHLCWGRVHIAVSKLG